MDGTLADTSPGILDSYIAVARMRGVDPPSEDVLRGCIGGSLRDNLGRLYNISGCDLDAAVKCYRDNYADVMLNMSHVYPGITVVIPELYRRGYILSVASLKAKRFVEALIREWGMTDYFNSLYGVDELDIVSKEDMILSALDMSNCSPEEAIMIGDTVADQNAAVKCGVNFLACTYGYGYANRYPTPEGIQHIENVMELLNIFV